ncbi:hypothetical protein CAL12_11705 [Bordetella genomosp. 8]|uniref:Uncharacterized protein n=1 Tax=Bordetella genomosp. 8 TaxID=1416806 RepID=A0A1W6YK32_9BORD|nr:hypothetical protein [Bordetella genomosp. 8]ARP81398.1 hypothetical protein CAL12_11705 [Bordetella genomosp. 8]
MSVAAIHSAPAPALFPVVNASPPASPFGQGAAAESFASYATGSTQPERAGCTLADAQSAATQRELNTRVLAHLHDTIGLQNNVKLLKRASAELAESIRRVLDDRGSGTTPGATQPVAGRQAAFDFIVADAKRTGLFDELKSAGIQRLKDSGNHEAMIEQVMAREADAGRPRDRAWAESWIERQFDPSGIDAAYRAGEPYMDLSAMYEGAWAYGGNKGCAAVYGDRTDVQAAGPYKVRFIASRSASDNRSAMSYIVENQLTGETTAPRPYDERGTIIEVQGLRARMFGAPADGDMFSFDTPARYRLRYPDGNNRILSLDDQKALYKSLVFNRLFEPVVRGPNMETPEETVDEAFRQPVAAVDRSR